MKTNISKYLHAKTFLMIYLLMALSLVGCSLNAKKKLTPSSSLNQNKQVELIFADTVFLNATIWTGVKKQSTFTTLATKEGKIVYVGNATKEAFRATEFIDLNRKFLMHGFMDNHVHFMEDGAALTGVDLRDASTPEEFSHRIEEYANSIPKGRWVLTGNWDHERWGGKLPHKNWIDEKTKDTPVYVIRLDGHMGLANSAALKIAGIDKTTPTPEGGIIVRDDNGEPTGILKGSALNLILKAIPTPSDDELMEQFSNAQNHALSLGLTKVHAVTAYPTETTMLDIFKMARDRGIQKIRAKVSTPIEDLDNAKLAVENGTGDSLLSWGGVKGFIDGSLGSSTAWFYEPYKDDPNNTGKPLADMKVIEAWLRSTDEFGLSPVLHAIGNKAIDELMNTHEKIAGNDIKNKRYRIEHFQHPTLEAIKRAAKNNYILSMQPYHAIDDGRWAEEKVNDKVIRTTYAFRTILDNGGKITFGSDWPVAPLSPLDGVYAAVTRRTTDNKNPNGWQPQEKITVEEALTAYTVNNAYADFLEDTSGTLEVGKNADLVVLSDNPLTINPNKIKNIDVLETYINGKLVYKNKSF